MSRASAAPVTVPLLPRSTWTSHGPVQPLTPLYPTEVRGLAVHWPGSTGRWGTNPTMQETARRLEAERVQHTSRSSSDPTKPWADLAYCVPPSVEALTDSGWKRHNEIAPDDRLYTINCETGLGEWQRPSSVSVFSGPRRMLQDRNGLLTTPQHRWPVRRRKSGRYGIVTSENLTKYHQIPRAARSADQPADAKYKDDFVALVAWFWTEGHIMKSRGKQTRSVAIYQSHEVNLGNVREIHDVLTRLYGPESPSLRDNARTSCRRGHELTDDNLYIRPGGSRTCRTCWLGHWRQGILPELGDPAPRWSMRRSGKKTTFHLNATIGAELLHVAEAPDKVVRRDFLLSLTPSQLELFIRVSVAADGWVGPSGAARLLQKVTERSESFAFACVLAGRAISYTSTNIPGRTPMAGVNVLLREHTAPVDEEMAVVDYDGDVWCPTTPNGTWLARDGNRVFFTGNSLAVDLAGRLFDGRGLNWRPAANGDADVNRRYVAVTVLMGADDPVTLAAVDAVRAARALVLDRYPHATEVVGHRDLHQTKCPGPRLYDLVRSGAFTGQPTTQEADVPLTPADLDAVRTLVREEINANTPAAVWRAGWPAPTPEDPKHVETAQDRLVWAARGSGLTHSLDTILGMLRAGQQITLADETVQALADAVAARIPAGQADPAGVAHAVRAELAAALTEQ